MKTKILLIMVAWSMTLSAWSQQSSPVTLIEIEGQLGYWIVIATKGQRMQIVKTPDIVEVTVLLDMHFPGNCVDFTKELSKSPFYSIDNDNSEFYVEVKRINRHGHYRRLSNRQFRMIVETQRLASPDITTN